MDEFTYANLFDTKGIEYIIIIAFLLMIIPFWKFLNRPLRTGSRRSAATSPLSASVAQVPQGLYFSNTHTWAHMLRSGEARIGVDSLLSSLTGEVSLKMLREPGTRVKKGDELSELIRDGKRLSVVSPISGTVTGINRELLENASLMTSDPYTEGWICSVKPDNWIGEIAGFHFAEDATAWLRRELERTRDFLAASTAGLNPQSQQLQMQDGGEPAGEPLASMPEDVWHNFQKEFLR